MRFGVRIGTLSCLSLLLLFWAGGPAGAQTSIMAPGAAAVTGFSGVPAEESDQPIDLDGPSLRVIALPGGGDFGLVDAARRYTATAGDIGQVFGVTLDNEPQPDIYAAATSVYGLAIFTPDGPTRRGKSGADYVAGQFGPDDQGGGPNSIWRIDGRTGQIALFANVGDPTPASLGGIAFDPGSQQIFAADRATGLIHRFAMNGADQGTYDHGEEGREAAGLDPVAFDPSTVASIENHSFDSEDPDTWGLAPVERRVFALAVHSGRLYYSVADGPSVWSVGIANDGSFGDDPRFETTVPALHRGVEITAITFDSRGWMYVAERGASTGDSGFVQVADDGRSRVKRFQPKPPDDPEPGFWVQPGDEYAIGMPPDYHNADGGTALYCNKTIWSTGERLLDDPSLSPDEYPHVDGLQGNDISLVRPANTPPQSSWFVSYYDDQADPQSRGHMGQIAIWNQCGGQAYPPPPVRIGVVCPPGTFWLRGECVLAPICPGGTLFRNGYCLYPGCPWGMWRVRNACVRPPRVCRRGTFWFRDRCVPIGCPRDLRLGRYGYCGCPDGLTYRDGRCVKRPPCDPWLYRATNGTCRRCPDGSIPRDGRCIRRPPCDPVLLRLTNGNCRRCPDGTTPRNGVCPKRPPCNPVLFRASKGTCRPCPSGQYYNNGQCVRRPPCNTPGITAVGCLKPKCRSGYAPDANGRCVRIGNNCKPGLRGCLTNNPGGRIVPLKPLHVRKPTSTLTNGCRGRHCGRIGTGSSSNASGNKGGNSGGNVGNNGRRTGTTHRCRGQHCGRNSGTSGNGGSFGNNEFNKPGNGNTGTSGRGSCFGRNCGSRGQGNAFGNGNQNGNPNGACPPGEKRHRGRCVPDNQGGNSFGNQGSGNQNAGNSNNGGNNNQGGNGRNGRGRRRGQQQ